MKMSSKLKRAFGLLGKLQKEQRRQKTPVEKSLMSPSQRRRIERQEIPDPISLIRQGFTVEELKAQFSEAVEEYKKLKEEYEEKIARRKADAEKNLAHQQEDFYRICLGGTYGIFGTFDGYSGRSKTGQKIAEEVKQMDTETIREAINKLRKGDTHGYPLENYPTDYIEQVINYLSAEIQSRG